MICWSADLYASSGVLLNGSFWCTPYCSHRSHTCGFFSFWNRATLTCGGAVCFQYWTGTWNCSRKIRISTETLLAFSRVWVLMLPYCVTQYYMCKMQNLKNTETSAGFLVCNLLRMNKHHNYSTYTVNGQNSSLSSVLLMSTRSR